LSTFGTVGRGPGDQRKVSRKVSGKSKKAQADPKVTPGGAVKILVPADHDSSTVRNPSACPRGVPACHRSQTLSEALRRRNQQIPLSVDLVMPAIVR